jgi:hypothetical protein
MQDKQFFNVQTAIELLKSPLYSNKYVVTFAGHGSKIAGLFNSSIGLMANSVTMPTPTYEVKQQYIGGINISIPNRYELGQLDMTLYNTGKEYHMIQKWGEAMYNQKTGSFAYVNDVLANIQIMQYDKAANRVISHIFSGCTLYSYGGIQLTYEESTSIETFNVTIQYRGYTVTKH